MYATAERKVESGKFLRVRVDANETFTNVTITGDFFLHPEHTLPAIEQSLTGLPLSATKETIEQNVQTILHTHNAELIGASAADIAQLIEEALQNRAER